jgi:hypothetical protein
MTYARWSHPLVEWTALTALLVFILWCAVWAR